MFLAFSRKRKLMSRKFTFQTFASSDQLSLPPSPEWFRCGWRSRSSKSSSWARWGGSWPPSPHCTRSSPRPSVSRVSRASIKPDNSRIIWILPDNSRIIWILASIERVIMIRSFIAYLLHRSALPGLKLVKLSKFVVKLTFQGQDVLNVMLIEKLIIAMCM